MSYYKNNYGKVAKVLRSWGRVVVMLEYKTIFFNDPGAARSFLVEHGYY